MFAALDAALPIRKGGRVIAGSCPREPDPTTPTRPSPHLSSESAAQPPVHAMTPRYRRPRYGRVSPITVRINARCPPVLPTHRRSRHGGTSGDQRPRAESTPRQKRSAAPR